MERIKPETLRKIKVLRAYELAKESITHPCFKNRGKGKMSVTKEQIAEMDRKAGLPKERYTYVTRTITCEECGQEYEKEFAELTWPHLVGRCYCGAPRIQRSLDSEPEDTCNCDCFFRPKEGAVNLCDVKR